MRTGPGPSEGHCHLAGPGAPCLTWVSYVVWRLGLSGVLARCGWPSSEGPWKCVPVAWYLLFKARPDSTCHPWRTGRVTFEICKFQLCSSVQAMAWISMPEVCRSLRIGRCDRGSSPAPLTSDRDEILAWIISLPPPVKVVYQAGPTGFGWIRFLLSAGIETVVAAPAKFSALPVTG